MTTYSVPNLPRLRDYSVVAIDTETYDPNLKKNGAGWATGDGKLIGISVATDDFSLYLPVAEHYGVGYPLQLLEKWAARELCVPRQLKVGANIMYDLGWLMASGIKVSPPYYDVQWADVLINENHKSYSLSNIAKRRLGDDKDSAGLISWITGNIHGAARDPYAHIHAAPLHVVARYAEKDAELPLQIRKHQLPDIEEQDLGYVLDLEHRLIPLLIKMRMAGVRIDESALRDVEAYFDEKAHMANLTLRKIVGRDVNPNAPTDLVDVFTAAGIEIRTTDAGRPSFSEPVLSKINHPVAEAILNARKYLKTKATFIDGYMSHIHDGRLHAEFHPLRSDAYGTVSGRFSSSRPNLQNIPSREPDIAKRIRSLFIPEKGELWGAADWSQVEYRIMLCFAKGYEAEKAREMFITDPSTDFHQAVADMVGIDRQPAKSINFGILYGMGVDTLRDMLGVAEDEAHDILSKYHSNAPYVKELSEKTSRLATAHGYVKSLSGRRHRFNAWEIYGADVKFATKEEAFAYARENGTRFPRRANTHTALNRKVQGSAADVMKEAMVACFESGVFDVLTPLITVHDEMDVSVPDSPSGREAFTEMCNIMERIGTEKYGLEVPLKVDSSLGNNWSEAK